METHSHRLRKSTTAGRREGNRERLEPGRKKLKRKEAGPGRESTHFHSCVSDQPFPRQFPGTCVMTCIVDFSFLALPEALQWLTAELTCLAF